MTAEAMTEMQRKMAALRQRYIGHLQERVKELSKFKSVPSLTEDQKDALMILAHNLAGSGKTYGFPPISEAAIFLEDKLLSGQVRIQNELDALILAVEGARKESPGEPQVTKTAPIAPVQEGQPKLFLIDDDADMAALVTELFAGKAGVVVETDGLKAVERLSDIKPQLVLLDDKMPGMGGLDIIKAIRQHSLLKDIPIIMLTASSRPDQVMRGLVAGAIDYITKPFDPAALFEKVQKRLGRSENMILIADDDRPVLDLLSFKFRAAGFQIETASDGVAAYELMQKHKPSLVLLDVMMPGNNGLTVFQQMQDEENLANIPVVFLTARHNEREILGALELGAADYITKPFSADEVVTRCVRLLKKSRKDQG